MELCAKFAADIFELLFKLVDLRTFALGFFVFLVCQCAEPFRFFTVLLLGKFFVFVEVSAAKSLDSISLALLSGGVASAICAS